jgi:hypothetical protein
MENVIIHSKFGSISTSFSALDLVALSNKVTCVSMSYKRSFIAKSH